MPLCFEEYIVFTWHPVCSISKLILSSSLPVCIMSEEESAKVSKFKYSYGDYPRGYSEVEKVRSLLQIRICPMQFIHFPRSTQSLFLLLQKDNHILSTGWSPAKSLSIPVLFPSPCLNLHRYPLQRMLHRPLLLLLLLLLRLFESDAQVAKLLPLKPPTPPPMRWYKVPLLLLLPLIEAQPINSRNTSPTR